MPQTALALGKDTTNGGRFAISIAWAWACWIPAVPFLTHVESQGSPKTLALLINFLPEPLASAKDFFMGIYFTLLLVFFLFTACRVPYHPALLLALHFPLLSLGRPQWLPLRLQPLHPGSFSPVASSLCLHTPEADRCIRREVGHTSQIRILSPAVGK